MATDLKSTTDKVSMTRFWGGVEGTSVQLTVKRNPNKERFTADLFFDSIAVNREQARTLAADLLAFANGNEQEDL